jgi:hypothetical protein
MLREIGWPVWVGGIVAWLVVLAVHQPVFGVAPVVF